MDKIYKPQEIEGKWQEKWYSSDVFKAVDFSKKEKFYSLIEFPYPSGEGLHVGHPRSNTAMDIISRKRRMQGFNVLYPIGWDAFGLPAENYAIKTGTHPKETTQKNIANFTRQLKALGFSFDWSREIDTTDPKYYKWTQWIFLKLFEKGLAYKAKSDINWCTSCNVGLAHEEVVNGKCERCGGEVVRKEKEQWMLKITEYADRLLADLNEVDYVEKIKKQQEDWIGKSIGAEVDFKVKNFDQRIKVFTTRPDTLFGATYMVLSPEHSLIEEFKKDLKNKELVEEYQKKARTKTDLERTDLAKEKTGIVLDGVMAINPVNEKEIPIYIADYVLNSYGTGAIMAVPGHDQRDWEFAKQFHLPIIEVLKGGDIEKEAFEGDGELVNSDWLNGLKKDQAIEKMIQWLEERGIGTRAINYKLRDWVFSRQRYWGEPIPIVICDKCGYVPVPEKELPVVLPEVENYKTSDTGESPLSLISEWVTTKCPQCGGQAKRETDTMPQWAGSSWYFLRYTDPHNDKQLADPKKLKYWTPVDWYNGGMEHTTLHLLYSRFWHKFLFDIGIVPTSEPYAKRTSHGLILGEDGDKMSKSKGNVINPDDVVNEYGADTFRVYEMFMGPFDQATPWDTKGILGVRRFLDKVWHACDDEVTVKEKVEPQEIEQLLHKTIKKVTEDIENMKFNTAVSQMMIFINEFNKAKGSLDDKQKSEYRKTFLKILSPFAPHICEELWHALGEKDFIAKEPWPEYNPELVKESVIEVPIQINGKVRSKILVAKDASEEEVKEKALADEKIKTWLKGKEIKKFVYVKGRIVNIVV